MQDHKDGDVHRLTFSWQSGRGDVYSEDNKLSRRIADRVSRMTTHITLLDILRVCGIRNPRWYSLFGSARRSLPLEPDLMVRLAVFLQDDPVELYAQALMLLFPANGPLILRSHDSRLEDPSEQEITSFFQARTSRAIRYYELAKAEETPFALAVFHRLIALYHHRSRRQYSMQWLAAAASTHVMRIHQFLVGHEELHPWEMGSVLRIALYLELDPLELLDKLLQSREGERSVPLLGKFEIHFYDSEEMFSTFAAFSQLWQVVTQQLLENRGMEHAMRFTEHFLAWKFLSWPRIRRTQDMLKLFEGREQKELQVGAEALGLTEDGVARLTACWTLLWETTLALNRSLRSQMVEHFLHYWQVYSDLDDVERLVLESQMRLTDEARELLPEIEEKERSKLFPELRSKHTKKGQG